MAAGRILQRRIAKSRAINAAIAGIDKSQGFGHGAYAALLATWLIAFQDREGRVSADAGWLRAEIFPLLSIAPETIEQYLRQLAAYGVFLYYEAAGLRCVQFEGIRRCNKIPPADPPSVLPQPTPSALIVQPDHDVHLSYQIPLPVGEENASSLPPGSRSKRKEKEVEENTGKPDGSPVSSASTSMGSASPPDLGPASTGSPPLPTPGPASTVGSPPPRPAGSGPASTVGSPPLGVPGPASTGSPPPLALDPPSTRGAVTKGPPLPFGPAEAYAAMRAKAPARVPEDPFPENLRAPLVKLIRQFPELATWALVGEWLAAGGEGWRDRVDVRAVVKGGNFSCWVGESRRWDAAKRPRIEGASRPKKRTAATGVQLSEDYAAKAAGLFS